MDVEQRAREILAAEYEQYGDMIGAAKAREQMPADGVTIRAIIAALTPPEGYEKMARDAARYNYLRSRLLDTCMRNDAGVLIFCDERNGPELDALIDSEIDERQEVPDGRG